MHLWSCPRCKHQHRAPGRMRKDNAFRFCLTCSMKTGKMVERTCAALDKKRGDRAVARKATQQKDLVRVREKEKKRWSVCGLDTRAEVDYLWTIAKRIPGASIINTSTPLFSLGRRRERGTCGRAWRDEHRMRVAVGPDCTLERVVYVIAHELAHLIDPKHQSHGPNFWRLLSEILVEGYGIEKFPSHQRQHGVAQWSRYLVYGEALRATKWYRSRQPVQQSAPSAALASGLESE